MGEVVGFGGETTLPIATDKVLDGARHLNQVAVLGWAGNDFYMATSEPDLRDVLLLLEIAKRGIMDRILDGH
jgi:hypothetical protein